MSSSRKGTTGAERPANPLADPPGKPLTIHPTTWPPTTSTSDTPDTPTMPTELKQLNPRNWTWGNVKQYLEANKEQYQLQQKHIDHLHSEEVSGRVFVTLTRGELVTSYGLPRGAAASIEFLIDALKQPQAVKTIVSHPNEFRQKRVSELCEVLPRKKAKQDGDVEKTTGYSNVSWNQVKQVYEKYIVSCTFPSKPIPEADLENLYQYLGKVTRTFGGIFSGKEAKRLHFIAPLLVSISELFAGDISILVEENIPGKHMGLDGQFEFVIQRNKTKRKICIIEAKKELMEQGLTQDLLGCDAVASVESLDCVCGIVTNYLEWVFIRSLNDKIERDVTTLAISGDAVEKAGLAHVLGKIYTLLSEDFTDTD